MKKGFIHQGDIWDIGINHFEIQASPEIAQNFWDICTYKPAIHRKEEQCIPYSTHYETTLEIIEKRKVGAKLWDEISNKMEEGERNRERKWETVWERLTN